MEYIERVSWQTVGSNAVSLVRMYKVIKVVTSKTPITYNSAFSRVFFYPAIRRLATLHIWLQGMAAKE
jgi:hypothetical protein